VDVQYRTREKLKVSSEGRTLGRGKGEACRAERGADAERTLGRAGGQTLGRELVSGEILTAFETETVIYVYYTSLVSWLILLDGCFCLARFLFVVIETRD
jgi:hypothetical protein